MEIPFRIVSADVAEESQHVSPNDVVRDIACQKGQAVYKMMEKEQGFKSTFFPLVVASDTIVTLGDKIYGKPGDVDHAREMLRELSGKMHEVTTGVYIGFFDLNERCYKERVFTCETDVKFKIITRDLLELYLSSGESLDKAGAYGIQGRGLTFISHINGSYSNVVGFPVDMFIDELKDILGYRSDNNGEWRNTFHAFD